MKREQPSCRLDGQIDVLPDRQVFLYSYVRKEAVLSSQIEGRQSSLNDLLTHEMDLAPGVPRDDVAEVSCYVAALELGMQRHAKGLPVALRLITELHGQLLSSRRGSTKQPGEFRRSQNWNGGTRIKAALAHVQCETIHPFLDGNGRLGRLLIALILSMEGTEPLR